MKRRLFKAIAFCLLFVMGGLLNISSIKAASANIEITADNNQITVGDSVYVYITIDLDTIFSDIEANLVYDENILEYKSGASFIKGSSGFLKIADVNISEADDNRKYALEFKAIKVGKCEIEFSGQIMVYDYETGMPMSVSSNILELEVKAAHTASDNASLASLKISPSQLNPAFDKNIYEYNTNVAYDVEKLVVVALPEDEKATIRISGNETLKEGENKVITTVVAESGKKVEYVINVTKESAPEDELDIDPITPDNRHGSFELIQEDNEIFAIYNGKYKLLEPASDVKIPEGYTKTNMILSGISISVYEPNLPGSDFVLIYAENELGEANFYRYDKVEKTLQRFVEDIDFVTDPSDNIDNEDQSSSKKYRSKLNKAAIVISILCALCAGLVIVVVRLYIKNRKQK